MKITDEMATEWQPYIRDLAKKYARTCACDPEDLVSAGFCGLMHAANRFDQAFGAKFHGFAKPRIKGAMKDFIRSQRVRRSTRAAKEYRRLAAFLPQQAGHAVSHDEILMAVRQSLGDETITDADVFVPATEPIGKKPIRGDDNPTEQARHNVLKEHVLAGCNEIEAAIIVGIYYRGQTAAKTARQIGISESRVSQIRLAVLKRLRERLNEEDLVNA